MLQTALVIIALTLIVILVPALDARFVKAPIISKELHALQKVTVEMVISKILQMLILIFVKLARILIVKPARMVQILLNVRFAMSQIVISKTQIRQRRPVELVRLVSMVTLPPMLVMIA